MIKLNGIGAKFTGGHSGMYRAMSPTGSFERTISTHPYRSAVVTASALTGATAAAGVAGYYGVKDTEDKDSSYDKVSDMYSLGDKLKEGL